jgi:cell division inhibitor SepF
LGKIVDKLLGIIGLEVEEKEEYHQDPGAYWVEPLPSKTKNNIVGLPAPKPVKMVIMKPMNFDQVQSIADHLKNRRPVLVNLEETDKEVAKRIMDFMSGTAYAVGGNIQRVNQWIFLFCPNNVEVTGELPSRFRDNEIFSWPGNSGTSQGGQG